MMTKVDIIYERLLNDYKSKPHYGAVDEICNNQHFLRVLQHTVAAGVGIMLCDLHLGDNFNAALDAITRLTSKTKKAALFIFTGHLICIFPFTNASVKDLDFYSLDLKLGYTIIR